MRWKLAAGAAIVITTIGLLPTAASAQSVGVGGSTSRGYGGINNDGKHIYACDTNADNWGVRTYYMYEINANPDNYDEAVVADGNGSKTGCGTANLLGNDYAYEFDVCSGVSGANTTCTGWIYYTYGT
jgi:hypothetical protein